MKRHNHSLYDKKESHWVRTVSRRVRFSPELGMTRFERATPSFVDLYSNPTELHSQIKGELYKLRRAIVTLDRHELATQGVKPRLPAYAALLIGTTYALKAVEGIRTLDILHGKQTF